MKIIKKEVLTNKELAILNCIIKGHTNKEIADALYISVSTVKTHIEKMFLKFGVHNKVALIVYTLKNNIIDVKEDVKEQSV